MLTAFLIWLVGYFVAYIITNRLFIYLDTNREWTDSDRKICLGISILSWIMVIIDLIMFIVAIFKKEDVFKKYIIPALKLLEKKEKKC